jgi:predicted transcriptional regulator
MSARAAARLESLGFTLVYRYQAGKADWLANGWPAEGTETSQPRAKDLAHQDVPTCHLKDKIGEVRQRVQAAGWNTCVVVDQQQVVLGLLGKTELQADPQASAEAVMKCGPRTYRLDAPIEKIAEYMHKNHAEEVLVTNADGKLVGVILEKDVVI